MSSVSAEIWERRPARGLTWPTTRLARWFFSLLLTAELYLAAVGRGPHGWQWFVLAPATAIITLGVTQLFEAVGLGAGSERRRVLLLAPVLVALLATWLMAGAMAIVGLDGLPLLGAPAFFVTLLTLAGAEALRAVELREQLGLQRVYFIGTKESQADLQRELARCYDVELVGATVIGTGGEQSGVSLQANLLTAEASTLVLEREAMRLQGMTETIGRLRLGGVRIAEFAAFYEAEFKKVPLAALSSVSPASEFGPRASSPLAESVQRTAAAAVAVAVLVVTLPVLVLAGIAIKRTSPGPVLYRQRRVGRDGAEFTLVKLRTMITSTQTRACWAQSDAHRVTRLGRVLRRFRIDELPQLWNVIRGELALIGPRPEQVPIVERLLEQLPDYWARHCVRPGLTGWAQVNLGYAGSVEGAQAKLQRDLFYIKHRSARLDALIVWLTLTTVFAGRGA